jgi:hypothetical protein
VAGDPLTEQLENSWRRMNRSSDHRWLHNLALWDEARKSWRYVGAMTRSSQRHQWFTEGGVLQNFDDAYLALQAGLFLTSIERENASKKKSTKKKPAPKGTAKTAAKKKTAKGKAAKSKSDDGGALTRVALGFGMPIKGGEQALESFLDKVRSRLVTRKGKRVMDIRAKNVATAEEREQSIEVVFSLVQFQAYGSYMVLLFSKFDMKLYNTYVVDVGHGTWITLPVVENEADIALADSIPAGIHAMTGNISQALFESSGQKVKVQEQRIMEKIALGQREIEVPGAGVYNFDSMLDAECEGLADEIMKKIRIDVGALGAKGVSLDYVTIIGGGSKLIFDKLKKRIADFFVWDSKMANERIVGNEALPIDPRYANTAGLMLLARDQIALDLDKDVDPSIKISEVVSDNKM